jgi:hypothetical protein
MMGHILDRPFGKRRKPKPSRRLQKADPSENVVQKADGGGSIRIYHYGTSHIVFDPSRFRDVKIGLDLRVRFNAEDSARKLLCSQKQVLR